MACPPKPRRSASWDVRPGCIRRALAPLRGGGVAVGRHRVLHSPRVPALDRPARRRPHVRAAALCARPASAHHAGVPTVVLRWHRAGRRRCALQHSHGRRDRAAPIRGPRSARTFLRLSSIRAGRGLCHNVSDRPSEHSGWPHRAPVRCAIHGALIARGSKTVQIVRGCSRTRIGALACYTGAPGRTASPRTALPFAPAARVATSA